MEIIRSWHHHIRIKLEKHVNNLRVSGDIERQCCQTFDASTQNAINIVRTKEKLTLNYFEQFNVLFMIPCRLIVMWRQSLTQNRGAIHKLSRLYFYYGGWSINIVVERPYYFPKYWRIIDTVTWYIKLSSIVLFNLRDIIILSMVIQLSLKIICITEIRAGNCSSCWAL